MKKINEKLVKINKKILESILSVNKLQKELKKYKIPKASFHELLELKNKFPRNTILTDDQKKLISKLSREMMIICPFSDYVIKGFIFRAILKWEKEQGIPVLLLAKSNYRLQKEACYQILEICKEMMARSIFIPDKRKKRIMIDKMFDEVKFLLNDMLYQINFISKKNNKGNLTDLAKYK